MRWPSTLRCLERLGSALAWLLAHYLPDRIFRAPPALGMLVIWKMGVLSLPPRRPEWCPWFLLSVSILPTTVSSLELACGSRKVGCKSRK